MDTWTLDAATHELPEVVRRALGGEPQVVVPAGDAADAVVVLARSEYQRLTAPADPSQSSPVRAAATGADLADFFRNSPLAEAVAAGEFDLAWLERDRDPGRDADLG